MILNKLFKLLKKNSHSFVFLFTLIYFLYTYVSIFLYVFNNAVFYLLINTSLVYFGFHFIVRALTYPGSLHILCKKTDYDNRIELCKFYLQEVLKFATYINKIRQNVEDLYSEKTDSDKEELEHGSHKRMNINFNQLFNEDDENYDYGINSCFKFFNSVHIFYSLYVCYYLYVNLEQNVDFSEEQFQLYFYLKSLMANINRITVYVNRERDIVENELFTEIKIRKDFNPTVVAFLEKYSKQFKNSSFNLIKNKNFKKEHEKTKGNKETVEQEELEEDEFKSFIFENTEKEDLKQKTFNENTIKEKETEEKKDTDIKNSTVNCVEVNALSLFYHENYEKSILPTDYKKFFISINVEAFTELLKDIFSVLRKIGDILKKNSYREKWEMSNIHNYLFDFYKPTVVGSLGLFKYELIYKYYAKQDYLQVNNTQLDCMFIPSKSFIKQKMEKYISLKKEERNKTDGIKKKQMCIKDVIFMNAFNNGFYNFIYDTDFMNDIPVLLYFNPNASYYEQNACSFNNIEFYLERGINVFVYNYRGYSRSKGIPNLNRNNEDALQLSKYLLSKKVKYLGLHGRSIGGPLCSYVSYNLNNFDKKNKEIKLLYNINKNEIQIKRSKKEINKIQKMLQKNKRTLSKKYIFFVKCGLLLILQLIRLAKLKISYIRLQRLRNSSQQNFQKKHNYEQIDGSIKKKKISDIAFICIDKSFSVYEEVAKYMVGEYAYNILQFTSYKLDITKYYVNSNVPKILIYDNNDEVIHYLSNVITGVSIEICKFYKHGKMIMDASRELVTSRSDLNKTKCSAVPSVSDCKHKAYWKDDVAGEELLPLIDEDKGNKDADTGEQADEKRQTDEDKGEKEKVDSPEGLQLKKDEGKTELENSPLNILDEKCCYTDYLIIDEYVDRSWMKNKLKTIDIDIFLESWKILNDYYSFIYKTGTTHNSFISMGLECYNSIIAFFNPQKNKLEKETNTALHCIYSDDKYFNFIKSFKIGGSNYENFLNDGTNNKTNEKKKKSILDMLNEEENYKHEMHKLNKILKDLYMSKRKEIEKVHFTYSGFFLKTDYLYDLIDVDHKDNDKLTFNIEETDIFKFANEFSNSLSEILDAINTQFNSGGQKFCEIHKVTEKDKPNFVKAFIKRMKVFGSYPPQCFSSSKENEFSNFLFHIPFILSNYCEIEKKTSNENDYGCNEKNESYSCSSCSDKSNSSSNVENNKKLEHEYSHNKIDVLKKSEHLKKKRIRFPLKNRITIKESFEMNRNFYNENNLLKPYVTIEKSLLLHDIILCLNLYKKKENEEFPNIFYKLDDNAYLIDLKELLMFLKKKRDVSLKSTNFLDIFLNDIGIDVQNYKNISTHLDKYVSWLRLNNRMSICKIFLLIENELNNMRKYSKKLITEYNSIQQNSSIQSIIFLIYRISLFKKLLTHTYVLYIFFQRINKSMDLDIIENDLIQLADLNPLTLIKSFRIFYKSHYKVYTPRALGYPLLVNSGHNGNLNKSEENFLNLCVDSFLH